VVARPDATVPMKLRRELILVSFYSTAFAECGHTQRIEPAGVVEVSG
jgi:hypothetical protein